MSPSQSLPDRSRVPDAFIAAFDGYIAGRASLERASRALARCLDENPGAGRAVQDFLAAYRDRGGIDDAAFEVFMAELDQWVTEDVPTEWSEAIARTHHFGVERAGGDPAAGASTGDAAPLGPGAVLKNRFVLYDRLSGGTMGQVFKALDRRREETGAGDPWVAIKVVTERPGSNSRAFRALRQEAACGQRLSHPNIVRIFDIDRDGSHTYMSMEWLKGESLAKLLDRRRRRPMPRLQTLQIIDGLCRGLAYAHSQGLVHADVKPGNILIAEDGWARLLDFGVARALRDGEVTPVRGHTPEYASCEVLEGQDPTAQDDIFSAACVAYRMLAGERAFGRRTALAAESAGLRPTRVHSLAPGQWRALDQALAFRRVDRQADITTFIAQLKGPREEGPPAGEELPGPSTAQASFPSMASPAGPVLAGLLVAALLGTGWWLGRSSQAPGPGPATLPPLPAEWLPEGSALPGPALPKGAAGNSGSGRAVTPPGGTALEPGASPHRSGGEPAPPRATAPLSQAPKKPAPASVATVSTADRQEQVPGVAPPAPPPLAPPTADDAPPGSVTAVLAASTPAAVVAAERSGAPADTGADAPRGFIPFSKLRLKQYVAAAYPPGSADRGESGWVEVEFALDGDGHPGDVRALAADPPGRFESAAVAAVRRWRFEPPDREPGAPDPRSRIRIRFRPE